MIPHNRLTYGKVEEKAVQKTIRSGYWAGGKDVEKLEHTIKKITGRKYAMGVSSGFSALRLSLLALGVGEKDEVIIPAYSCVALPNAVLACGATPVPVDILNDNWNINFENIQLNITANTKAILAVNTFGLNADFTAINTFKIPVIEDCAHALGKVARDYIFGKQAMISTSSFYATKLIGGGEGGIVMTDNKNISQFVYFNRDYSDKKPSGLRLNEKMSNIHASLCNSQLGRIKSIVKAREKIAYLYNEEFIKLQKEFPEFIIPEYNTRIWYRYVVYCKNLEAAKLIKELKINAVSAAIPVANWMTDNEIKEFPVSSKAYNHLVSLPLYPTLTKSETKKVVDAIKKSLKRLF